MKLASQTTEKINKQKKKTENSLQQQKNLCLVIVDVVWSGLLVCVCCTIQNPHIRERELMLPCRLLWYMLILLQRNKRNRSAKSFFFVFCVCLCSDDIFKTYIYAILQRVDGLFFCNMYSARNATRPEQPDVIHTDIFVFLKI